MGQGDGGFWDLLGAEFGTKMLGILGRESVIRISTFLYKKDFEGLIDYSFLESRNVNIMKKVKKKLIV